MLIAYLVVEIIQRWIFAFADPLRTYIQVKVIETSISIYAMHTSTVVPSLNAIA